MDAIAVIMSLTGSMLRYYYVIEGDIELFRHSTPPQSLEYPQETHCRQGHNRPDLEILESWLDGRRSIYSD